jgi:hypothetical protein
MLATPKNTKICQFLLNVLPDKAVIFLCFVSICGMLYFWGVPLRVWLSALAFLSRFWGYKKSSNSASILHACSMQILSLSYEF